MGDGGTGSVLHLPPETFARYQTLRGRAPAVTPERDRPGRGRRSGRRRPLAGGETTQALSSYSLQGVYFNPKQFDSVADCLTAASSHGLPLDLCQ